MKPPSKRSRIKRAIRLYSCPDGPSWEEALQQVGLTMADLDYWRRRRVWVDLFAEVAQEMLVEGYPIAVGRLVQAAKHDKSSAGVTAAKTLVDIGRTDTADADALGSDQAEEGKPSGSIIEPDQLRPEERAVLYTLFGRLRLAG